MGVWIFVGKLRSNRGRLQSIGGGHPLSLSCRRKLLLVVNAPHPQNQPISTDHQRTLVGWIHEHQWSATYSYFLNSKLLSQLTGRTKTHPNLTHYQPYTPQEGVMTFIELMSSCLAIRYTSRKPVWCTRNIYNLINLMLYNININRKTNEVKTAIRTLLEKNLRTTKL